MENQEVQGRKLNSVDQQYCDLLQDIYRNGRSKGDRTGTGTKSVFGRTLRFNMSEGFPLITSKKMYTKGIIVELLWFLGKHMKEEKYAELGRTNIRYLVDNDCNIWVGDAYKAYTEWWDKTMPDLADTSPYTKEEFVDAIKTNDRFAAKHGDLGPIYGKQWTDWGEHKKVYPKIAKLCEGATSMDQVFDSMIDEACEIQQEMTTGAFQTQLGYDQVAALVHDLKVNPDSRRLLVNAWNPGELDQMVLPPCHYSFQCYTELLNHEERIQLLDEEAFSFRDRYAFDTYKSEQFMDILEIPKRRLSLSWNQRSVDVPLGLPFNIASYGFLLHMLADLVGMVPGDLIGNLGDTHIYNNQLLGADKQVVNPTFPLPKLKITPGDRKQLTDYNIDDFVIEGYQCAGILRYPLSN